MLHKGKSVTHLHLYVHASVSECAKGGQWKQSNTGTGRGLRKAVAEVTCHSASYRTLASWTRLRWRKTTEISASFVKGPLERMACLFAFLTEQKSIFIRPRSTWHWTVHAGRRGGSSWREKIVCLIGLFLRIHAVYKSTCISFAFQEQKRNPKMNGVGANSCITELNEYMMQWLLHYSCWF